MSRKRAIIRFLEPTGGESWRVTVQVEGEGTQIYDWSQNGFANAVEDIAAIIAKQYRQPLLGIPDPLKGQLIG